MALLTQGDLQYKYSWTAIRGDDPRVTGVPDSTMFNRHEGYEVLWLINHLAAERSLKQKESGLKLERMIRNHLPSELRSQAHVASWLVNNWNNH